MRLFSKNLNKEVQYCREEKSKLFESFWETYPDRNGIKNTRKQSLEWWTKQPLDTLTMVLSKTKLYRKYIDSLDKDEFNGGISDPIRYLKNEKYNDTLKVTRKSSYDNLK